MTEKSGSELLGDLDVPLLTSYQHRAVLGVADLTPRRGRLAARGPRWSACGAGGGDVEEARVDRGLGGAAVVTDSHDDRLGPRAP